MRFLNSKISEINELAQNFSSNSRVIVDELAKIDVRLSSMQERMSGNAKRTIVDLREHIKIYERMPESEEKFNQVYRGILRVVEEVKELQQDLNLE